MYERCYRIGGEAVPAVCAWIADASASILVIQGAAHCRREISVRRSRPACFDANAAQRRAARICEPHAQLRFSSLCNTEERNLMIRSCVQRASGGMQFAWKLLLPTIVSLLDNNSSALGSASRRNERRSPGLPMLKASPSSPSLSRPRPVKVPTRSTDPPQLAAALVMDRELPEWHNSDRLFAS